MLGMPKAIFVRSLTAPERIALEAGVRSPDAFMLRRCQILLANARGETYTFGMDRVAPNIDALPQPGSNQGAAPFGFGKVGRDSQLGGCKLSEIHGASSKKLACIIPANGKNTGL